MKQLEQKYHGMPAAGTVGQTGEHGDKGRSIYIGFINDFFDCDEYEVAPEVRYTKRKVENLRNTNTWSNYKNMYSKASLDQIYYTGEMVDVADGFIVNNEQTTRHMDLVSYNDLMPGESLSRTFGMGSQPVESYESVLIKDVSYGIPNGAYYEYTEIYDFEDTTEEDKLFGYSAAPSYIVRFDINHITYDYSDLRRLAEFKLLKGEDFHPWDFYTTFKDDGTQYEDPTEEQYKSWLLDPQMFPLYVRDHLGGEYAQYREGVTEYYGIEYGYYAQYNNLCETYMSWALDNTKDGKHYLEMPDVPEGMTAYDDMTYAFMYFKQPILFYPSYQDPEELKNTDHMVDSEGIVYIGISDKNLYQITPDGRITFRDTNSILMGLRSDEENPLNEPNDIVSFDATTYINAIRDYTVTLKTHTPKELVPTDNRIVWHPGGAKVIKIPRALSTDIHAGDVIYFYTDETEFNTFDSDTNGKIKYMAVISEDMVGCDLGTLLEKKQLVDPFTYKVIDTNESEDRSEIKQSTVITAGATFRTSFIDSSTGNNEDIETEALHNFNMKSLENIITEDSDAALTVVSVNIGDSGENPNTTIKGNYLNMSVRDVNQFDPTVKKQSQFNLFSKKYRYLNEKNESVEEHNAHLNVTQAGFQIDNLGIPYRNNKCNYELTDVIYDPNIKFSDTGHFICDFMNAGNIESTRLLMSEDKSDEYVISFRFKKSDILKLDKMRHGYTADDYVIGYTIYIPETQTESGITIPARVLEDIETEEDECIFQLRPFFYYNPMFQMVYADNSPGVYFYDMDSAGEILIRRTPQLWKSYKYVPYVLELAYDIKFTVRRKDGGMRYYSNTSTLSVWMTGDSGGKQFINESELVYQITEYTVNVQYPDRETTDAPTGSADEFVFEIDELTCEDYTGAIHEPVELKISKSETSEHNVKINKILANGIDIYNLNRTISNSWCKMNRSDDGSSDDIRTYTLSISDNIPDVNSETGILYQTRTVEEYMESLNNESDLGDAPLFNLISARKKLMQTVARSINIIICYTLTDESGTETELQVPYKITQPGFTEPRAIPEIKLSLTNDFENLDKINTLDNGVMCNQFRTYLDIEIDKFNEQTWGLAGMEDITIDFTVSSVSYDYDYIKNNPTSDYKTRPFIKLCTNTLPSYVYKENRIAYQNAEIIRSTGAVERMLQQQLNVQLAKINNTNTVTGTGTGSDNTGDASSDNNNAGSGNNDNTGNTGNDNTGNDSGSNELGNTIDNNLPAIDTGTGGKSDGLSYNLTTNAQAQFRSSQVTTLKDTVLYASNQQNIAESSPGTVDPTYGISVGTLEPVDSLKDLTDTGNEFGVESSQKYTVSPNTRPFTRQPVFWNDLGSLESVSDRVDTTDTIKLVDPDEELILLTEQDGIQNYYTVTCEGIDCPVEPVITSELHDNRTNRPIDNAIITLDGKEYIIMNKDCLNLYPVLNDTSDDIRHQIYNYSRIDAGIRHDINIKFSGIQLYDIIANNKIRVAIDLEFGNPVIAQLFYQFAVTDVAIHYKGKDFHLVSSSNNTTYLSTQGDRYTTYRYITNPLRAYVNPISMIAASAAHEGNITSLSAITGTIKKVGDNSNISVVAELYNNRMYAELISQSEATWNGIWPLSQAFNDDIQNLEIKAVLPADIIDKVKLPAFYTEESSGLSPVINADTLTYKPVLGDISDNKYFTIFYNAQIFHPRYRNGVETFYYNDEEYEAARYSQYNTESGLVLSPIYIKCEPSILLRTDDEMDAIDTWNFEYQVYREGVTDSDDRTIPGKNTLYGNGWKFLNNEIDEGQYDSDGILSLDELRTQLADRTIFHNESYITSVQLSNSTMYPNKNELFRSLVYDMKWEFPYETFAPGEDGTGMQPYIGHAMLVAPFDALLSYCMRTEELQDKYNNQLSSQSPDYLSHYNALAKRCGKDMIPYNLCYDMYPRIGYNADTNSINIMMLRRPAIGYDSDSFIQTETYYPDKSYLGLASKVPEDATVDLYSTEGLK